MLMRVGVVSVGSDFLPLKRISIGSRSCSGFSVSKV